MSRLNILYIHSHDTGRYVQPYGYAVETPRIQQLAEEGVLFRQAFCANPTCSASRSVLLTGRYAHSNRMIGLAHRGSRLNDYRQHLASFLSRNGYETALSGCSTRPPTGSSLATSVSLMTAPGNTQEEWPAGQPRFLPNGMTGPSSSPAAFR